MHYTRKALLVFGAGLLIGLAVVSANISGIGWVASTLMALGLALIPLAIFSDWWSHRPWRKSKARKNKRKPAPRKSRQKR